MGRQHSSESIGVECLHLFHMCLGPGCSTQPEATTDAGRNAEDATDMTHQSDIKLRKHFHFMS